MKILKEPMSFAQFFCLIIAIACIWFGAYAFNVIMGNPTALKDATVTGIVTVIITGVLAAFAACYKYITSSSASSAAKDEAQIKATDKLTDAAINSTPIVKN